MYTLDTNAVIYFLSGDDKCVALISRAFTKRETVYVPSIVRLELLSKSDLSVEEYLSVSEFLRQVRIIDLDNRVADLGADIRRVYGLKTPDAVIAATAIYTNSILLTRNTKDFKKVKELKTDKV